MKTALEILKGAREIVAAPGGWYQGQYQREARADDEPETICCCALGALGVSFNGDAEAMEYVNDKSPDDEPFFEALAALDEVIDYNAVSEWNDYSHTTQADVVEAFDKAIALKEAA